MSKKLQTSGSSWIQPGKGRNCFAVEVMDYVATQVEENRSQTIGSSTVWYISASANQPRSTVHKIIQEILRNYPYKLSLEQQLLSADLDSRQTFALQFLALVELQDELLWNILDRFDPLSYGRCGEHA